MVVRAVLSDYVSVHVAAGRSGYTRAHIHNLAKKNIIGSEMVTPSFRLVSWPDIVAYMDTHPRQRSQSTTVEQKP